jgi:hypothetical protein
VFAYQRADIKSAANFLKHPGIEISPGFQTPLYFPNPDSALIL